jgi:type II secretory pathway component PulM
MMTALNTWWQARTSRERLILRASAALCFLVLLPVTIYGQVADHRTRAASDLAAARAVLADVGKIAAAGPQKVATGDNREIATAAAVAHGLTIARLEPQGADGLVVVFGVSDSRQVYQWIDAVGAAGLMVRRSAIVRADEGPLVTAEFEIGRRR